MLQLVIQERYVHQCADCFGTGHPLQECPAGSSGLELHGWVSNLTEAAMPMAVECTRGSTQEMPIGYAFNSAIQVGGDYAEWIVDCGATKHCTNTIKDCIEVWPIDSTHGKPSVVVGNKQRCAITHVGNALVHAIADASGAVAPIAMSKVLIVPEMGPRLFSCGAGFANDGVKTLLNGDCFLVTRDNSVVQFTDNPVHYSFCAHLNDETAFVHPAVSFASLQRSPSMSFAQPEVYVSEVQESALDIHRRLAHFSMSRIIQANGKSTGID